MRSSGLKEQFYVTYEEKCLLQSKADKAGLNKSEFLRSLIHGTELKEKPGEELYEFMKVLRSIGVNMNQIARVANLTGDINKEYYQKEADKFNEFMLEVKSRFLNKK